MDVCSLKQHSFDLLGKKLTQIAKIIYSYYSEQFIDTISILKIIQLKILIIMKPR